MSSSDGKKWYLHIAGRPEGPYAAAEAVARAKQAGLGLNAPVWLPGWSDWSTLGAVPDLQDLSRSLGAPVQIQPSIGENTSVRLGVPSLPGTPRGALPGGPTPLPSVQPPDAGVKKGMTTFSKVVLLLLFAIAAFLFWLFPELWPF